LRLAAGDSSDFVRFEVSADSDRMMLLRVVDFGSDHAAKTDPAAKPPLIHLRTDTGPEVAVPEFPDSRAIVDEDETVGSATWIRKDPGVYLVRVSPDRMGSSWDIRIANEESDAHTFQIMSLGSTKIRTEDDLPGIELTFCGRFPCACTSHECGGEKCSQCGHEAPCA
jgi:hypothetical protein